MAGLELMQERFCEEMSSGIHKTKKAAAIAAGYSENTAGEQASRLLRNVKVKARIKELQREALISSGYDKEKIRELIMRRLTGIVATHVTDIVHVSPDDSDPNRPEVLRELAELHGGQMFIDFGDTLVVPTASLTEDESAAIKSIKIKQETKEAASAVELDMHDPIAAAKLLAEISGIKEADSTVNVTVSPAVILQQVEARKAGASANG